MRSRSTILKTYTDKDFDKAERLERLRMYLVEPQKFELSQRDWDHFEKVKNTFYLSVNEISRAVAVSKIIATEPGISLNFANQLFDEAQELFGSFIQVNQFLNKQKIVERLAILADKAYQNAIYKYKDDDGIEQEGTDMKYMEMTRKLLDDISKLNGFYDQTQKLDPSKLTIPKLIISSDPQVFYDSRKEDSE